MNKERLTTLAEHLRTVPTEKFNMETWSCGTTACAVGHAASVPEFKKAGFKLIKDFDSIAAYPSYKFEWGWPAVEAFFDLGEREAVCLFDEGSYPMPPDTISPVDVANRIDRFIAEGGM